MALFLEIPEKFARDNRGAMNNENRFDFTILKDGAFVCSIEAAKDFATLLIGVETKLREVTHEDFLEHIYHANSESYSEPPRVVVSNERLANYLLVQITPKVINGVTATQFSCFVDAYNLKGSFLKVRYLLLAANNEIVQDDIVETTNTTIIANWKTNGDIWLIKRIATLLNLTAL